MQIFDANGDLVDSDSSPTDSFVQFATNQNGTFTALVHDSGGDESMDFRIRVLTLPGNPLLIEGRDGVLLSGEQLVSSVPIGGFSVFRFQITSTGTVIVSVGETDGSGEPFLQIFDPNGDFVGADSSPTDALVQYTTFQPGTYTAVVNDSGGDESMGFNIIATGISDEPPALLGDVNGDGDVNLLDVAPFVELLTSGGFAPEADVNQDGEVDLLDVGPFVDLLTGS